MSFSKYYNQTSYCSLILKLLQYYPINTDIKINLPINKGDIISLTYYGGKYDKNKRAVVEEIIPNDMYGITIDHNPNKKIIRHIRI